MPYPCSTAAQVTDGSQYHVLLIITDGVISDMMQTKEAIVTVSGRTPPGSGHHVRPRCRRAAPHLWLLPSANRPLRCPCPSSLWEWGRLSSMVSGVGWGWGRAGGCRHTGSERCLQPWRSPLSHCPQFVPFRDYMDSSGSHVRSMARLAKDVLAEIPDQLLSYMRGRGIEPRRNAAH